MYTYVGVPNYYQGDPMYPYGEFPPYTTSYRPAEMQMPMRPSALGMPELHHHQQHYHQPLVDHSPYIHTHQHHQHHQPSPPQHTPAVMAYSQSEDEMAQLQKLSAEFQPEVTVSLFPSPHPPRVVGQAFGPRLTDLVYRDLLLVRNNSPVLSSKSMLLPIQSIVQRLRYEQYLTSLIVACLIFL
jgi:hypothetical protein